MTSRSSALMLVVVLAVCVSLGLAARLWYTENQLRQEAVRNQDLAEQARASLIFVGAHNRLKDAVAKHGSVTENALENSVDPYRVEAEKLRKENEILREGRGARAEVDG